MAENGAACARGAGAGRSESGADTGEDDHGHDVPAPGARAGVTGDEATAMADGIAPRVSTLRARVRGLRDGVPAASAGDEAGSGGENGDRIPVAEGRGGIENGGCAPAGACATDETAEAATDTGATGVASCTAT